MHSWTSFLESEKDYFKKTLQYIDSRKSLGINVYPPQKKIFNAFDATPFDKVKIVILGQDPYHGENQAHGLCFSVLPGIKPPPSLINIYKELENEYPAFKRPHHGYLQSWAEQGVFLLNTVLTVEQGKAHSHKKLGWENFTDKAIQQLNQYGQGIIFLLWGAHAQKKGAQINLDRHYVLTAPHPSPLSAYRGFLGCGHFKKANQLLHSQSKRIIDWNSLND